jgi:shikimate kinase
VTRGFHYFREINTVTYDNRLIDVDTMVDALKEAGTYAGIAGKGGPP